MNKNNDYGITAEQANQNIQRNLNPIEPEHYNKGKTDLIESWYLTYPFNEFRAIVQGLAERYIKRDKHNRLIDLDKAIYTLERLKQYEKKELEEELIELQENFDSNTDEIEELTIEIGRRNGEIGELKEQIQSKGYKLIDNGSEMQDLFDKKEKLESEIR